MCGLEQRQHDAKPVYSKLESWIGDVRTATVSRLVCGMQSCLDRIRFYGALGCTKHFGYHVGEWRRQSRTKKLHLSENAPGQCCFQGGLLRIHRRKPCGCEAYNGLFRNSACTWGGYSPSATRRIRRVFFWYSPFVGRRGPSNVNVPLNGILGKRV